jgi:tetratricopeptide (TPR) repeat protein
MRALTDRRPAAVADWLQGEREYRRSQFASALPYFRRALAADSALVPAALRGAEAASWLERRDEATDFLTVALRSVRLLPPKYADFARGLRAYSAGRADSAVAYLSSALRSDSTWSDAWTALGEVYYHLIPSRGWTDSSAALAFRAARRADPTFTPPLFHLAEIAVRRGDLAGAESIATVFRRYTRDTAASPAFELSLACARQGADVDWAGAANRDVVSVVDGAGDLAAGAAFPACAEAGFRAALASGQGEPGVRWNALLGLQSLLLAEGRREEARTLLVDAVARGQAAAMGIYVVDAVAGYGMDDLAAKVIESLAGPYQGMSLQRLWYHGIWAAHRGERERLDTIVRTMERRAAEASDPDTVLTGALSARLALMAGDTAGAVRRLQALVPSASRPDLASGLWQSLGSERLLLGELLLRQGRPAEALDALAVLDHPQPRVYPMYLPSSLALREQAAGRLGLRQLAERFGDRGEFLASVHVPKSTR